jgi:UTP:GlnB (protein PII) uridylyltransferase
MLLAMSNVRELDELNAFVRSMPAPYASVFEQADTESHFRVVQERNGKKAHAGMWRELPEGGAAVCVVADDTPGLLSLLTTAFTANGMDVVGAQIFCRERLDGVVEAVDLFWLRPVTRGRCIEPSEVVAVSFMLTEMLQEHEQQRPSSRTPTQPNGLLASTRVYFDVRSLQRGESVLVVETPDCPGLVFAITSELYRQRAEIVASDIRTHGAVARDRFTLTDEEGRPLNSERLASVQQGVRAAVRLLEPRARR